MKNLINKLPIKVFVLVFSAAYSFFSFAEPANLALVKNAVIDYHDSGLYEKELTQAIEKAQSYIVNQALLNQKKKEPQKLAVVLDIDETSLSNYVYMIKRNFVGTRAQFHSDNMAANTPAIKPMLELYNDARRHGVEVFFITGRSESEREATSSNLNKAGYEGWAGLYLRPNHYSAKSIIPFKSHARQLINQEGYTIIATIGDQYSDLEGGYANKGFKLPNPYYYLP